MLACDSVTPGRALLSAFSLIAAIAACASGPKAPPPAVGGERALEAAEAERPGADGGDAPLVGAADGGDAEGDDGGAAADDTIAPDDGPCPDGMVFVARGDGPDAPDGVCIDRYEASLVEIAEDGSEQPYPHYLPVDGHAVRAVSVAGVFPQGFISEVQAQDACVASGKRLCRAEEWKAACEGTTRATFPYGDARRPGVCNDHGRSAVLAVFGAKAVAASTSFLPPRKPAEPAKTARATKPAKPSKSGTKTATKTGKATAAAGREPKRRGDPVKGRGAETVVLRKKRNTTKPAAPSKRRIHGKPSTRPTNVDPGVWAKLNDPRLGQVDGALARTGEHAECAAESGALDMVGNLHEWVATDPAAPHGTFAGGYYLDTSLNGDGCRYRTVAHAHDYHDYSTGFRCCADARTRP